MDAEFAYELFRDLVAPFLSLAILLLFRSAGYPWLVRSALTAFAVMQLGELSNQAVMFANRGLMPSDLYLIDWKGLSGPGSDSSLVCRFVRFVPDWEDQDRPWHWIRKHEEDPVRLYLLSDVLPVQACGFYATASIGDLLIALGYAVYLFLVFIITVHVVSDMRAAPSS